MSAFTAAAVLGWGVCAGVLLDAAGVPDGAWILVLCALFLLAGWKLRDERP